MKKKIFGIIILFISTLGIEQIFARYYQKESSAYNYNDQQTNQRKTVNASEQRPVDCSTCCREGRFISQECAAQCNRCQIIGSDETKAEAFDFPN